MKKNIIILFLIASGMCKAQSDTIALKKRVQEEIWHTNKESVIVYIQGLKAIHRDAILRCKFLYARRLKLEIKDLEIKLKKQHD